MLFDLKGRRRRMVQATYLTLAVLMGGGLVLFGIGGEVSGGLFDAFSDRNANSSSADDAFEERAERARKRLAANPRDAEALKALVRANYQIASAQTPQGATSFPAEAQPELRAAARAWEQYLATDPDPVDASLANLMLQAYGPGALNRPAQAVKAAEVLAESSETPQAYILLAQYAALAGQDRKADLAGQKAIDLAPKDQRDVVKQQVEQAKAAAAATQGGGAQDAQGSPPGG